MFRGHYKEFDLYSCDTGSTLGASLIARDGDHWSEYTSAPAKLVENFSATLMTEPCFLALQEALARVGRNEQY